MKYTLTTVFIGIWFTSFGQEGQGIVISEPSADDEEMHVFDCYQTYFLDSDLQSIEKVEVDGKELEFEFIPDKKQLILQDYKGKGKINCQGTSSSGEKKEYSKSPCYIDPCENAL